MFIHIAIHLRTRAARLVPFEGRRDLKVISLKIFVKVVRLTITNRINLSIPLFPLCEM